MRPAGRRVSAGGDGFGDEADAREAVPGGFAHDLRDDAAGSPVAATDAAGNVIWREGYRAYGERTRNETAARSNRQFFHGKAFDADSGLSYFGARYYDPVVGRFMAIDPAGFDEANLHSFNRYAYGNNNPYRYRDPNGKWAEDIALAIPGLALGAHSLWQNAWSGRIGDAVVDALGIVADGAAAIVPGVPGGVGLAIAATRSVGTDVAAGAAKGANPKSLIGRQGRDEMSGSKVNRLAKDMEANGYDPSHPIDVANVDGKLIILDGHHRAQAAAKAGVREVPVNVHIVSRQQADQLMREAAEARMGK